MRSVALILAVFFAGLTVIPCTDAEIAEDTIETVLEDGLEHQHDSESDLCSPFCVCQCCHTHLIVHQVALGNFEILLFPIQESSYKEPITEPFIGSLLQPPQV